MSTNGGVEERILGLEEEADDWANRRSEGEAFTKVQISGLKAKVKKMHEQLEALKGAIKEAEGYVEQVMKS